MDTETITIVISILAILISIPVAILTWFNSKKANKIAENALAESQKSNGIAANALAESGKSNISANYALDESKRSNQISIGNLELLISERIDTSQDRISTVFEKLISLTSKGKELTDGEKRLENYYQKLLKSAMESNLNAYEDACGKYIDDKLDKKRFRKSYLKSIENLVRDESYKDFLDPTTTQYEAILKVFKEWHRLEN
ncbi:MAG: hypothetical protein ACJAWV_003723 [Flammeovirgaceae bacterium]|jgi:hypothetical protein